MKRTPAQLRRDRTVGGLHRATAEREKATRDFLGGERIGREEDELIDELDDLLTVTATVKGLRAAEEA